MTEKKLVSRIKAALLSAVMTATLFVSPAVLQTTVTAADTSVNLKLTASASTEDDAPNKGRVAVAKTASTVTFNFKSDSKEALSIGVFGMELLDDPYWIGPEDTENQKGDPDVKQEWKVKPVDGKGSFTYKVPAKYQGNVKKICIGLWYPTEGVDMTITSYSTGGSTSVDPGPVDPVSPTSANKRSGAWSVTKNDDGTTTISSTLTAVVPGSEEEGGMDYLLTRGYDEDYYKINKDEVYEEGVSKINAHKFKFTDFGLKYLTNVTFESFNYVIKSDKEINSFQYGGGINVQPGSLGDTECLKKDPVNPDKNKDGFWYNDQGEEDMETYGDVFKEKLGYEPHGKYEVTNAGSYFNIVWDVPKDVQPWVSQNNSDTVGIQFWHADDANPPEGEDYAAVDEVHLISASCTYTTSITVDLTPEKVNKTVGQKLTPGADESTNQYHYELPELGLKDRDLIYAIKFNVSSSADITKFTGGAGISVDAENKMGIDGWYDPGNLTILDPEKGNSFELMWVLPEGIINDIYKEDVANVMFGAWYAGENAPTLTLDSIDFYVYHTKEADLTASPSEVELEVGQSKNVTISVPGSTIDVPDTGVVEATINDKGIISIEAINKGEVTITVTSPEGQEIKVPVKVVGKATTTVNTTVTTKPTTTSTKPTTTTVDPDSVIDWTKVKYGDVNVDGRVDVADLVELNQILLEVKDYKNATAKENADCEYNSKIEQSDSTKLLNFLSNQIKFESLGLNKEKGIELDS